MLKQFLSLSAALVFSAGLLAASAPIGNQPPNWAETVKLPAAEKPIKLFNGKDLTGWEGQIDKYWSVDDGTIKATNKEPVAASTYLFTKNNYRNFRLLLEVKQTRGKGFSTMHSGVCCLGEKLLDKGDPFSFKGPLLMCCNDWGFYDLNRRNRVAPPAQMGNMKVDAEKVGEWNQIEILVIGNRLRYVANGQLVIDYTDKPEMLKSSPIGLQLHSNKDKEEYRFRGLILSENPEDRLLTEAAPASKAKLAGIPGFRMQEIATDLKVGYAVLLVDIDGDGKKDIVVVDTTRVVWYQNPTWKMRTILQGQTLPDNVCIDAYDIDGDGQIDLALGAGWKPANTKVNGTLQWLKRGKSLDEQWTVYPIGGEPTVHRIRFIDIDGTGKPALVLGPLQGRGTTPAGNWMDGEPVRLTAYRIPKDPTRDRWPAEVIDQSLHVLHNFCGIPAHGRPGKDLLCASYEGLTVLKRDEPTASAGGSTAWTATRIGEGNQANPKSNRGSSEVAVGRLKNGKKVIATIEPWHGNQVVIYTEPPSDKSIGGAMWRRQVLDDKLKWGHAVSFADLRGSGSDDLVVGVRDDLSKTPGERRGVRIYTADDDQGAKWTRHDLDPSGVAVEDLAVADLNGDGRPDIVAVGRQTGNVRIYWNEK
jgi:hypothetical protein